MHTNTHTHGLCTSASQIDMARVYKPVIDAWITRRLTELLGFDDDVLAGTITNSLAVQVRASPSCSV